jgi:Zn-dependent protease with chaperone function
LLSGEWGMFDDCRREYNNVMSELPDNPSTISANADQHNLQPLDYHREVVRFLKATEPDLWRLTRESISAQANTAKQETELLKATYRLDALGHPDLVARCQRVAAVLAVEQTVTLFQGTGTDANNASCLITPSQIFIVFSGALLGVLQGAELDAVLGHELAHAKLWAVDGGDIEVAARLLQTAAIDPRSTRAQQLTAKRFQQFIELYADRGAYLAAGALPPVVAALVKVATGLASVSGESYLRQAAEIFSESVAQSGRHSHPESFLRTQALALWSADAPALDSWLLQVIVGPLRLGELDVLGQSSVRAFTHELLAAFLAPDNLQTPLVMAHAQAFLPSLTAQQEPHIWPTKDLPNLDFSDADNLDYVSYLLLDFVRVDPDLDDFPLLHAILWAARLEISEAFEKRAMTALKITKRQWTAFKKAADKLTLTRKQAS